MKKIKVIIDGKEVITSEGKTVLEAAKEADIYIPTLCYHPSLPPFGGCRLCIVEIEGIKGYPTSCTIPVQAGMRIKTNSPELQNIRRQILELILTEHPNACLVCQHKENCDEYKSTIRKVDQITGCEFCPNNNQCELQEVVKYIGIEKINFPSFYRNLPIERPDPFFERDYNLCILCGRCVRVCQEIRGAGTLTFVYRGPKTVIGTAFNRPHLEAGCQFCGACVDVCPTGSLSEKGKKWESVPDKVVTTICPYCGAGCQLNVEIKGDRIIGAHPDPKGKANQGQACVRGRFTLKDIVYNSSRILNPMIRKNGELEEVGWGEAISYVTEKLKKYKGEETAFIVSSQLTNEDYYLIRKFASTALKTNNLDSLVRFTQFPFSNGLDNFSLTYSFQEIEQSKCIFLFGVDIGNSHPVINVTLKKAVDKGAKLFAVGPRKARMGVIPFQWIPIKPGGEFYFLLGIIKIILDEGRESLAKGEFENLSALHKKLNNLNFKEIEKHTGISRERIVEIAECIKNFSPPLLICDSELVQSGNGINIIQALSNLSLLTGGKLIPLWPESNSRGAESLGISPEFFSGPRKNTSGLSLMEILKSCENGDIKALYLIGDISKLEKNSLEILIVQNPFFTSICEQADVVLPACTWAETEGTFINSEGRIQPVNQVIKPQGNSKPDWWIVSQIGKKFKVEGLIYNSSEEITKEIKKSIPGFQDVFYTRLRNGETVFIKSQSKQPKKLFLFSDFPSSKLPDKEFPFTLLIRNDLDCYRGFSLIEKNRGIRMIREEGVVELNPKDAKSLNLSQKDKVKIISRYGEIETKVKLNENLYSKTAFLRSSYLTHSFLKISTLPTDPITRAPGLQLLPVKIIRGENV